MAMSDRGFASMVRTGAGRKRQREIAGRGGEIAHRKGTAHEWTSEEAREAGRKGGMVTHARRRQLVEAVEQTVQSVAKHLAADSGPLTLS